MNRHTFGKTVGKLFNTLDSGLSMVDTGFNAGNYAMKGLEHKAIQFERNEFAKCSEELMSLWADYVSACEALGEEPAITRDEFLSGYSK